MKRIHPTPFESLASFLNRCCQCLNRSGHAAIVDMSIYYLYEYNGLQAASINLSWRVQYELGGMARLQSGGWHSLEPCKFEDSYALAGAGLPVRPLTSRALISRSIFTIPVRLAENDAGEQDCRLISRFVQVLKDTQTMGENYVEI
jgi:hypothetical protein